MPYDFVDFIKCGEFWRLVIDGPKQRQGRIGFEETHYTESLIQAAHFASKLVEKKIEVDDLFHLHTMALKDVAHTNYKETTTGSAGLNYGTRTEMCFGLRSHNSSTAGMVELLKDIRDRHCGYCIKVQLRSCWLASGLSEHYHSIKVTPHSIWTPTDILNHYHLGHQVIIDQESLQDFTDVNIQSLAKILTEYAAPILFTRNHSSYKSDLAQAIATYHEKIASASTQETADEIRHAKLRAIAWLCREGARIHPFSDGNGRVFCMLLPYLLCLQQGFPIPLLRDPNLIGNHALNEIVTEMQAGFLRTEQLLSGKLPIAFPARYNTNDTDLACYYKNLLHSLGNHASTADTAAKTPYIHNRLQFIKLCHFIYEKDLAAVRSLISQQQRQDYLQLQDPLNQNALLLALKTEEPDIALALLTTAAFDPMQQDKTRDIALEWAIFKGYSEVSQVIITMMTPMQLACINPRTKQTPIILAIKYDQPEIAELIILAGANNLMHKGPTEDTALEWAIFKGNHKLCQMIIAKLDSDQLSKVNPRTKITPLMLAIKYEMYDIAIQLLEANAGNLQHHDEEGNRALELAFHANKQDLILLLIEKMSIEQLNSKQPRSGETILEYALQKNNHVIIGALCEKLVISNPQGKLSRKARHLIYQYAEREKMSKIVEQTKPRICRAQYWYDIAGHQPR
jgi:ankyrin repeat protein